MPFEDFLRLRLEILRDATLQEPLRDAPDQAALFERVLALGRERGYDFSIADLENVVNANRNAWLVRWLYQ